MSEKKFRLLTRSDFDGLVCAILLKELEMLSDIKFVHPKDMQDGKVEVTDRDILANLPYVDGCHLCIDHHDSEEIRNFCKDTKNYVLNTDADSAARVVYEHFGGHEQFSSISPELLDAVDKADSARFTKDEILNPHGWDLLSFLMDPRTGLGRFRDFRVSNYQLMMDLIDYGRQHNIDEILALPDVRERIDVYNAHQEQFVEQLQRCAKIYGNLVALFLRGEETIYAGNRFMVYALFPQCDISMHVFWGFKKQNTVFSIGKSILNRTCKTNVGDLCLRYGGGGHAAAGTCQVGNKNTSLVLNELIEAINADAGITAELSPV